MKRCPREHFTIATKFPTFSITVADRYKAAPIFEMQFTNRDISHFDYYLLHNPNHARDEQVVKPCGLFEFIRKKKAEGSYYSSLRRRCHAPEGEWIQNRLTLENGADINDLVRQANVYLSLLYTARAG